MRTSYCVLRFLGTLYFVSRFARVAVRNTKYEVRIRSIGHNLQDIAREPLKNVKTKTSSVIKRSALRRLLNNTPSFHTPTRVLGLARAADTFGFKGLRNYTDDQEVSIWTLEGRTRIPYVLGERQRRLLENQQGESDLVYHDGAFFLLATCNVREFGFA